MANIKIGDNFTTNEGYNVNVINYVDAKNTIIKFDDGTIITVEASQLRNGSVKNKNHKSVCNVGFNGYGEYTHKNNKKSYHVWCNMIKRCYNNEIQTKHQSYIGCNVIEEWHNFQVFCKWYNENYIVGFQIDKDLLFKNNKIYSSIKCCFLPQEINIALQTNRINNSNNYLGVRQQKDKFISNCSVNGKIITKSHNTIEEASSHYKLIKENHVKNLANKFKETLTEQSYNLLMIWTVN